MRRGQPARESLIAAVLSAFLLAACAGPGGDLPPLPQGETAAYRLGPGDTLRIITFGDDRLGGEFRVNADGAVSLPLIGAVPAAGRTTGELERAVASSLKRGGLVRDPSVSIDVTAYRPIFVLGEVNHPGQFPYQPGMTAVSAVAVAGGFSYRAIDDVFSVVRTEDGRVIEGRAERQSLLRPGDVLTIYERRF